MTITPVIDKEGAITNYIAIKKDVTDRKQLERQFLRSQRMESLGLLAGGVAHDLNNVLAPIMMSLEMLDKGLEPNKRRKLIAGIQNGCERGSAIIKQILAFSRGLKGEHVPVQVRHLIKDMVKFTRETFPKNISIVADIPGTSGCYLQMPHRSIKSFLTWRSMRKMPCPREGNLPLMRKTWFFRMPRQIPNVATCLVIT